MEIDKKHANDLRAACIKSNSLYMNWAEKNGINYFVLLVLYALSSKESMTQKEICSRYGVSKQTINGVIRVLKKDNYIFLEDDTNDKRAKMVVLTAEGKAFADTKLKPLFEIERKIIKNIETKRLENMIETMQLYNILFENESEIS